MSKEIDAIFQDEASQDQEPKEQRQHTKGLKKSTFLGEDKLEI